MRHRKPKFKVLVTGGTEGKVFVTDMESLLEQAGPTLADHFRDPMSLSGYRESLGVVDEQVLEEYFVAQWADGAITCVRD